jgi:hypothetical protein
MSQSELCNVRIFIAQLYKLYECDWHVNCSMCFHLQDHYLIINCTGFFSLIILRMFWKIKDELMGLTLPSNKVICMSIFDDKTNCRILALYLVITIIRNQLTDIWFFSHTGAELNCPTVVDLTTRR